MSRKTPGACSGLSRSSRVLRLAFALARSGLVIATLAAIACALLVRTAEARIDETLKGFASELSSWRDMRLASSPRTLHVNGSELQFVSASAEISLHEALDRLEALCEQSTGFVSAERILNTSQAPRDAEGRAWLHGVFREQSGSEGFIACLSTGGKLSPSELARRIARFTETGDLSAIGFLRYALARQKGKQTSALVLWTDRQFSLLEMFPREGDAPGLDPRAAPRPENAARFLSAAELHAPYTVTGFRTQGSAGAALDSYLSQLKRAGWGTSPTGNPGAAIARRDGHTVVVSSSNADSGSMATLMLLELS